MSNRLIALATVALVASAGAAAARDQIRIVGSSTVFPFSTAVAEQFGKKTAFPTPVVESTGSGGGLRLFCAGVGVDHPDITNASRRMKASEFETCQANGVTEIVEIVVGFDGIVVANAINGPAFELTRGELYEALHAGSDAETWDEVNPALPANKIEVLGPPPTSGTRDAFMELAMEAGCEEVGGSCDDIEMRADGAWVDAGENDNLIVQKLTANANAVGVFGYSFLEENADKIKGAPIDGSEPTFDNILAGEYPVSRSLYFYVKKAHVGVVPGIQEYVTEFTSDAATGRTGYAASIGLIPLPNEMHEDMKSRAANLTPLPAGAL